MHKVAHTFRDAYYFLRQTNNLTLANFKAEVQMRVNKFSSLLIRDSDLNTAYSCIDDRTRDRLSEFEVLCTRIDEQIEVQSQLDTDKTLKPMPGQHEKVINLFGGGRSDEKFRKTKAGNMTPMELAHTLPDEIREHEFESLYVIGIKPDGLQVKYSVGPHFHLEAQAMKELLYHMEMVRSWVYGAENL